MSIPDSICHLMMAPLGKPLERGPASSETCWRGPISRHEGKEEGWGGYLLSGQDAKCVQ